MARYQQRYLAPLDVPIDDLSKLNMGPSDLRGEAADAASGGDAAKLQQFFNKGLVPSDQGVLLEALRSGDLETVQMVLNSGEYINEKMGYMGTALIFALRYNHRHLFEYLISLGVDPNLGAWGLHPLIVAVRDTLNIKWIKVLLDKGAQIQGTGALHVASLLGKLERMRLLLEYGADTNEEPYMPIGASLKYHGEGSAIHWAIAGGHSKAVNLLLAHHPDLSIQDNEGIPAGKRLAEFEREQTIKEARLTAQLSLRSHSISEQKLNSPESRFCSRLLSSDSEAIRGKMKRSLHYLPSELLFSVADFLEEEKDINSLTQASSWLYVLLNPYLYQRNSLNTENSALLWASKLGSEVTARACVLNGANFDVSDKFFRSPLFCAALKGHEAVVKLLLETGKVDPDSGGRCNATPLNTAAAKGHEGVVKLLLGTEQVDLNSNDSLGATPLWWAASEGHEEVVRLLLNTQKAKIDSVKKDYDSLTSFSKAGSNGHKVAVNPYASHTPL